MASNRQWKRLIGLLFVLLIWGSSEVLAAVPAEINYQGRIEDLSGPVDGTLDLTFRLFDADVAGTIVWEEAHSVLVNQGVYNVILGTGTLNPSYGSLEEAVFAYDDLWLEVQVTGEADAMAPRQKITSVGFAMRAGSVSDGTITATMLADDAVTTDKLVDGAVTAAKVTGGFVPNLDADRLDGLDSASFSPSVHNHDGQYYSKTYVDALEDRIAALEAKLQYLTVVAGSVNQMPGPHVMITGANLHVRSGSGSTYGTINGRGNLIVGYNENTAGAIRTGSHNMVVGVDHGYTSYAGLLAGRRNRISGTSSSVMGYNNEVSASYSTVTGGSNNIVSSIYSSVSGGYTNTVSAAYANISGGRNNTVSGNYASVSGGRHNVASGDYSSVAGGGDLDESNGNEAFSNYSAILGGVNNMAGDNSDPNNHTVGEQATVSGGNSNIASGEIATVSGGVVNTASGTVSSVGGGAYNTASGDTAAVSGGYLNTAIGDQASVGGGSQNTASGSSASVSGGHLNEASGDESSVSGGYSNTASGLYSSVSGGLGNTASGGYSSVSGGHNRSVSGIYDWQAGGLFQEY